MSFMRMRIHVDLLDIACTVRFHRCRDRHTALFGGFTCIWFSVLMSLPKSKKVALSPDGKNKGRTSFAQLGAGAPFDALPQLLVRDMQCTHDGMA